MSNEKKPVTLLELVEAFAKLSPAKQKMAINGARVIAKK